MAAGALNGDTRESQIGIERIQRGPRVGDQAQQPHIDDRQRVRELLERVVAQLQQPDMQRSGVVQRHERTRSSSRT